MTLARSVLRAFDRPGGRGLLARYTTWHVPVVATRCGGISELVEDGATGFLVNERDKSVLADRMAQLAEVPQLRHDFGSAPRNRVDQQFNLDRQYTAFADLYRRIAVEIATQ